MDLAGGYGPRRSNTDDRLGRVDASDLGSKGPENDRRRQILRHEHIRRSKPFENLDGRDRRRTFLCLYSYVRSRNVTAPKGFDRKELRAGSRRNCPRLAWGMHHSGKIARIDPLSIRVDTVARASFARWFVRRYAQFACQLASKSCSGIQ